MPASRLISSTPASARPARCVPGLIVSSSAAPASPRWLHTNKAELLMVLDRPEIPLHTNGSENDIRCQVTRRKVSAGTRSDAGRDCRDAFLGLAKTCEKLGIPVWDYLGNRLRVAGHVIIQALDHYVGRRI